MNLIYLLFLYIDRNFVTSSHKPKQKYIPKICKLISRKIISLNQFWCKICEKISKPYFFTEAINCLSKAIDIYTDMGRFTIAAKHHQTIGKILKSSLQFHEKFFFLQKLKYWMEYLLPTYLNILLFY